MHERSIGCSIAWCGMAGTYDAQYGERLDYDLYLSEETWQAIPTRVNKRGDTAVTGHVSNTVNDSIRINLVLL